MATTSFFENNMFVKKGFLKVSFEEEYRIVVISPKVLAGNRFMRLDEIIEIFNSALSFSDFNIVVINFGIKVPYSNIRTIKAYGFDCVSYLEIFDAIVDDVKNYPCGENEWYGVESINFVL